MKNNISFVYDGGLCVGCGTCYGVCPHNAIKIIRDNVWHDLRPVVDINKCTNCNLCVKSCPGIGFDFDFFNSKIFNQIPNNSWIGNYKKIFIAHSLNRFYRYYGSSGGIATLISIYLLTKNVVQGVIVSKLQNGFPLKTFSFVAKTKSEIIETMGSIYAPTSPGAVLKDLKDLSGNYIYIGLPCHIHGLLKSYQAIPSLKKKIQLIIGLMCSNNTTFGGTELFIKKFISNINFSNIKKIYYRNGGWLPKKKLKICFENGESVEISKKSLIEQIYDKFIFHRFFMQRRCLLCIDHYAEFADISLGDPRWKNLELLKNPGESLVIIRTERGLKIWNALMAEGLVEIVKEINDENFLLEIQDPSFKQEAISRIKFYQFIGKEIPIYKASHKKNGFKKFSPSHITKYILSMIPSYYKLKYPFIFIMDLLVYAEYYKLKFLKILSKLKRIRR